MSSVLATAAPASAERRTRAVALLTAATMVVEVVAGWWFNSMALLADGWHMGTHAAAIGLSTLAYAASRRLRDDPRFAFGPWKIEILAAFASAMALLAVAVGMVGASLQRLISPEPIRYEEAMVIAVLGLVVNLVCAWILGPHDHGGVSHSHHQHGLSHEPDRDRAQGHDHGHGHEHADLNLRSAYLHVVADAATSGLAIVALAGGMFFGWAGLDPLMGIVGAVMVARWGVGLIRDSARILLDCEMDLPLAEQVRQALNHEAPWSRQVRLLDLKVWRVDRGHFACIVKLFSEDRRLRVEDVQRYLQRFPALRDSVIQIETD